MALFEKLFSTKRKLDGYRESRDWGRSCQITSKQVRLLLFKECDWRGRKLLFDSSTIEKVPAGKDHAGTKQTNEFPCVVEVAEGFAYVYKGPATDAGVLGEMIFGAVAMSCKGVSLKIHIMDEPKRLMCTKVFCVPTSRRISRVERKAEPSTAELRERSKPLNVPMQKEEGVSLSFSIDRGDSGFYGDQTPHSSIGSTYDYFSMFDVWDGGNTQDDMFSFHTPPGRKLSTSSNGSWQRRTFRNIATRFELGNSSNFLSVRSASTNATDSQIYSNSSTSGTSDSLASGSCAALKKNKLGLALLISVPDSAEKDFIRRCVEMSPQLQSLVCRLRLATMTAGAGGKFVATLHRAANDAAGWLSELISGPRLQPVWLRLVTSEPPRSHKMADSLLADLCAVLAVADTKNTNFFISTLLTHVLTYHLGWVSTVSPYDAPEPGHEPRPYNALWAQLADLYGAIGFPPRAARTIISGASDVQFVNRLLIVLTYFVRCGDVVRSDFQFDDSALKESETVTLKRTPVTKKCVEPVTKKCETVDKVTQVRDGGSALAPEGFRRSTTLANLSHQLSTSVEFDAGQCRSSEKPAGGPMRRNPTMMLAVKSSSDSSLDSTASEQSEMERKVVFVLGDDEKLVGLKNKSNGGKSVKRSSKVQHEPLNLDAIERAGDDLKEGCEQKCSRNSESPSKCCAQTLQHSKPIKHSGFKFEFDKYPQIVTNYMKSKNLEILDRHYIGKPGNLKLDNFQFDPTIVPAIQEERCEACYKCQMMESMLQTPTNASELEYMNDGPRQSDPQYAKESIVSETECVQASPKTFVRRKKEATLVVNVKKPVEPSVSVEVSRVDAGVDGSEQDRGEVRQFIEFSVPRLVRRPAHGSGLDGSLLGGVSNHYVPDLILQGTISKPQTFEMDLRRDLDLASYLNKTSEAPATPVAIVGDTDAWEVRVVGRDCGSSGMSALVGGMLDALPVMWKAKVPAYQCLSYLEGKLREFCVLSKTLADMLMSTDFCDIATLTKSLNIDVNDVPLLLAIATTHTPQVAARYGISYR